MDKQQIERNFSCVVCIQLAKNAVQGDCCGVLFCEKCREDYFKKNKKCPICKVDNFTHRVSLKIRRVISQVKVECSICSKQFQNSQIQTHGEKCRLINSVFENPSNFYKILQKFIQAWSEFKFIAQNHKQQGAKNQNSIKMSYIISQTIVNLLQNLKKHGQDPQHNYWVLLFSDHQNCSLIIFTIALIYFQRKQYLKSLQHCTKLINTQRYIKYILIQQQILLNASQLLILQSQYKENKHQTYAELTNVLQNYVYSLNSQIPNQCCNILISLQYLQKISITQQQIQKYTVYLSQVEDTVKKSADKLWYHVCQKVYLHSMPQQSQKQLQQVQMQIYFYFKTLLLLLNVSGSQQKLYEIISASQTVSNGQQFTPMKSVVLAKMPEYFIVITLISVIQNIQKGALSMIFQHLVNPFESFGNLTIIANLLFYKICHVKFKAILTDQKYYCQNYSILQEKSSKQDGSLIKRQEQRNSRKRMHSNNKKFICKGSFVDRKLKQKFQEVNDDQTLFISKIGPFICLVSNLNKNRKFIDELLLQAFQAADLQTKVALKKKKNKSKQLSKSSSKEDFTRESRKSVAYQYDEEFQEIMKLLTSEQFNKNDIQSILSQAIGLVVMIVESQQQQLKTFQHSSKTDSIYELILNKINIQKALSAMEQRCFSEINNPKTKRKQIKVAKSMETQKK